MYILLMGASVFAYLVSDKNRERKKRNETKRRIGFNQFYFYTNFISLQLVFPHFNGQNIF